MRIADLMAQSGQFISFEFFPPKDKDKWPGFFQVVEQLKAAQPLFVSVTYGAGGSTRDKTLELVTRMKKDLDLEPMAHLTCVDADEKYIGSFLDELAKADIDNVLALRGDPPKDVENFSLENARFRYAVDLVRFIRERHPSMGVGVAGYPETHPDAESAEADLGHLKEKLDAGGDLVISQLFFENSLFHDFVDRARALGITQPIIPGILPILSLSSVKRLLSLCGRGLPQNLGAALEEADAKGGNKAVAEVGIKHARKQVRELLGKGVPGVHLYSLNRADVCLRILEGIELA